MRIIKKNKAIILVVLVTLFLGLLFCESKRTFHCDESLSFTLANKEEGWVEYYPPNWLDSDTFKHYGVTNNPFDYSMVYTNQKNDCHPPLYYYLLHTISSLFPNKFTIWFGFIINIFSYLINSLLIYLMLKKYTKNETYSILGSLTYCVSKNTILYGVTFIKMYQLVSTFGLLFTFFATRIIEEKSIKYSNYIMLGIITTLGGLTHYYFYAFVGLCSLVYAIALIKKKNLKKLFICIIVFSLAVLINVLILFPPTLQHCFGIGGNITGHGANIISLINGFNINIEEFITNINSSCFGIFGIILYVVLLIIYTRKNIDKNINNSYLIIGTSCIAYMCLLYVFSDMKDPRFLMVEEPVFILSILLLIYRTINKHQLIVLIVLTLISNRFSYIKTINTKKSWEFAEDNKNKVAVVINTENQYDYMANTSFYDFRWYRYVGMTELYKYDFWFDNKCDIILYVDKKLNQNDSLEYINNLSNSKYMFKLKDDIDTTLYKIYYCKYLGEFNDAY